jgi:hypothetical protein
LWGLPAREPGVDDALDPRGDDSVREPDVDDARDSCGDDSL